GMPGRACRSAGTAPRADRVPARPREMRAARQKPPAVSTTAAFSSTIRSFARRCADQRAKTLAHREAIAPIGNGHKAAERHHERAKPDPVDEGFQIDAHTPRAGDRTVAADRFAKRDI